MDNVNKRSDKPIPALHKESEPSRNNLCCPYKDWCRVFKTARNKDKYKKCEACGIFGCTLSKTTHKTIK